MLDGFHKVYNVHALKKLLKRVDIPDASLGVAEGESLSPVIDAVKYPYIEKPVMQPELATQSYELTQIDGFADPLSEKDFANESYFGEAIVSNGGA